MIEQKLTIVNRLGLHARAAAQLVKMAGKFQSSIIIVRNDRSVTADAKSILSLLTLAASVGTVLTIRATGEDEIIALEQISALFDNGFGEL